MISMVMWQYVCNICDRSKLQVATINSIWIWCDQWKSIVCMLAICFEGTSFVCWPNRDRVSISSRSCVDFIWSAQSKIVCLYRHVFVGLRLRFEKSSPRWEIVGREGKILLKGFIKLCWRLAEDRCNQWCWIRKRVGHIEVGLRRRNQG